jgi:predicted nucleic acid-binding protein
LLNIIATGQASSLTIGSTLVLTPAIKQEALFVYGDVSRKSRIQIDDAELTRNGIAFAHTNLSAAEKLLFSQLSLQIDDGEAEALAVAAQRGLTLLTDDNAAIRVAPQNGVPVLTTLDLLRNWASSASIEDAREAARSLRDRGSYSPPRTHAHASWYSALL